MKILILEGIATSGKTTIKDKLVDFFKKKKLKYLIIEEKETLMPILNNTKVRVSINHLKRILKKVLPKKKDVIIFDRLYFTHIFRTKSTIKDFEEIESLFSKNNTFLAFLKIDKKKIPERIFNAMRNDRSKMWADYVRSKGNNKQIIQYYQSQQDLLLKLLKKSRINYKIYNTSKLNQDLIKEKILKELFQIIK